MCDILLFCIWLTSKFLYFFLHKITNEIYGNEDVWLVRREIRYGLVISWIDIDFLKFVSGELKNVETNLISVGSEARVPFRQHAFHAQKEGAFELVFCAAPRRHRTWGRWQRWWRCAQDRRHLVVIRRVDVLVDAVSRQLHLR